LALVQRVLETLELSYFSFENCYMHYVGASDAQTSKPSHFCIEEPRDACSFGASGAQDLIIVACRHQQATNSCDFGASGVNPLSCRTFEQSSVDVSSEAALFAKLLP
jgi:hypothetical protein